jgi:cell division protein ZapB
MTALEMTFKSAAYALTWLVFSNRVCSMDPELSALEEKLAQLVLRLKGLREENVDLRQQVAARTDENVRLAEKLAAAKSRIEALLKQIPETES